MELGLEEGRVGNGNGLSRAKSRVQLPGGKLQLPAAKLQLPGGKLQVAGGKEQQLLTSGSSAAAGKNRINLLPQAAHQVCEASSMLVVIVLE